VKVVLAGPAVEDLATQLGYIGQRNPDAADRLEARVFSIIERLAEGEFEGPEQRLRSGDVVRSWPVSPLRIYYQRTPDTLVILRVYHQARRPL
jgi:plasmid stabilization system protein ParE